MHLWVRLYLKWNGQHIGTDAYGNTYYREKKAAKGKQERRFVLYKGIEEASKIPPLWHSWLHYTSDDIPTVQNSELTDKTRHLPNLTGTPLANDPKKYHFTTDKHLKKPDYTAWNPN